MSKDERPSEAAEETHSDGEPFLVQCGADTRDPPSEINVGVEGTLGPDHLGQETVTIRGHKADRPGVLNRLPETDADDPRISRMDTGESLPVLLKSDMETNVTEGMVGSWTKIVEGECDRCGYDRIVVSQSEVPHTIKRECNACGARLQTQAPNGYTMPETDAERAQRERDSGETIGTIMRYDVIDLESETGFGPYVSLVNGNSCNRIRKSDIVDLFFMLVENDDASLSDSLREYLSENDRLLTALGLLDDFDEISYNSSLSVNE